MIRRSEHSNDKKFAITSRALCQDRRLSFQARGCMQFILSKPPKWEVQDHNLQKEGGIGRTALASIIRELKEFGYMVRVRVRTKAGKFEYVTEVYEEPQLIDDSTVTRNRPTVTRNTLPADGSPADGEQGTVLIEDHAGAPADLKIDLTDQEETDIGSELSLKPKRKKPYPKRKEWPRVVALYFAITNTAPAREVWDLLEEQLAGNPDPKRLRECFVAWRARDYRPGNIGWIDWYHNGIPERPGKQRHGIAQKDSAEPFVSRLRKPLSE